MGSGPKATAMSTPREVASFPIDCSACSNARLGRCRCPPPRRAAPIKLRRSMSAHACATCGDKSVAWAEVKTKRSRKVSPGKAPSGPLGNSNFPAPVYRRYLVCGHTPYLIARRIDVAVTCITQPRKAATLAPGLRTISLDLGPGLRKVRAKEYRGGLKHDFSTHRRSRYIRCRRDMLLGHRQVCQRPPSGKSSQAIGHSDLPRRDPAARAAACRNLLLGRFAAGPFEQACAAPPQNAARLYPATALLQVGHNLVSPSS